MRASCEHYVPFGKNEEEAGLLEIKSCWAAHRQKYWFIFEQAFCALPNSYSCEEPVQELFTTGFYTLKTPNMSVLGHCLSCIHTLSEESVE